jgi:hypothetical protein
MFLGEVKRKRRRIRSSLSNKPRVYFYYSTWLKRL